MTKTFDKENVSRFCLKRYIKLIFVFLFAYIISMLSTFVFEGRNMAEVYGNDRGIPINCFLTDMMGTAGMFGMPTLNPSWWYMSFAILLIFLYPLFYLLYEKMGNAIVIFTIFLPSIITLNNDLTMRGTISWYCLGIALGIVSAENNWFEKIRLNKSRVFIMMGSVLIIPVLFYTRYIVLCRVFIVDNILAFVISIAVVLFIGRIAILRDVLGFIGIHSANMYLLHSFIFEYYFHDFIYSDGWAGMIVVRLIVVTLALSVVLEAVKKLIGYKKLEKLLIDKVAP